MPDEEEQAGLRRVVPRRRVHLRLLLLLLVRTLHALLNHNSFLLGDLLLLHLVLHGLDPSLQLKQNVNLLLLGRGFDSGLSWVRAQLVDDKVLHEVLVALHELELFRGFGPCATRVVGDGRDVRVLLAFVGRKGREELGDGFDLGEVLVDLCVFEEVVEKDQ